MCDRSSGSTRPCPFVLRRCASSADLRIRPLRDHTVPSCASANTREYILRRFRVLSSSRQSLCCALRLSSVVHRVAIVLRCFAPALLPFDTWRLDSLRPPTCGPPTLLSVLYESRRQERACRRRAPRSHEAFPRMIVTTRTPARHDTTPIRPIF
jgi:hypothetical protein